MKKNKIDVKGVEIAVILHEKRDYVSLTDIARYRNKYEPFSIINNWMRNKSTIEFLGLWEKLNNPAFKPTEFDWFKNEAGSNYFVLSPQRWIKSTGAIGVISKSGRYGGTFAHTDIAFEFSSWISPEFKLYLITEFQRLKGEEAKTKSLEWNLKRTLAKVNYKIHTDAIKENLIPAKITKQQANNIYATEADILNMALFGMTAKEWRNINNEPDGNMRDFATLEQLVVLSNLESINSVLINNGLIQSQRLIQLNSIAISQMSSLLSNSQIKKLK